ncbi:MAG: L-glutamate gamma-semialdehyde dehydrogenase [Prochlorotrichaceae cyanobacterium]
MVAQVSLPYENETQQIAQTLLKATKEGRSFFAQLQDQVRLDDKLLGWTMEHPGLRVQLFHFIDCLPALKSKTEVARHLQEYMSAEAVELPAMLKNMLNFAEASSMPGQLAATTIMTAVETLAKKYIAGETANQVLKALEQLRKQKMAFTVDLLGEAVITEMEAKAYLDAYLNLLELLGKAAQSWPTVEQIDRADGQDLPKAQASVKLTAFYSQFDALDQEGSRARVSEPARILLRKAKELGVGLHFDMEQYQYKTTTLAILKDILMEEEFRDRSDVGVTLQAYLRDTEQDARDLIAWAKQRGTPITVRLVKGAYWDQETIKSLQKHWGNPVFTHKVETDANFEKITQLLLENHQYLYAAIGSHNVRSQGHTVAIAESLKVPRRNWELQVLYGMGDKLAKALVDKGYRVRVYCPYGNLIPGMAYLIRRLLENTANTSFLRQNLEDVAPDQLLAPPLVTEASNPHPAVSQLSFSPAADSDYADRTQRESVLTALEKVKGQLGETYRPLINGQYISTLDYLTSENPCNPSEIIGKVGLVSVEQAEEAVTAAKAALPQWKKTPPQERAAIIRRAGELLEQRRDELIAWVVLEVGKPIREADGEVSEAIDFCYYYASEMERLAAGYAFDVAGETDRYHYQPRGLALVISPWNFPIAIPTGMTVAALVAGNCTLLKPAETASVIMAKVVEILVEAGVPQGVIQYLPGLGHVVGAHLVKHKDIHTIAFTGSREVGCQIYATAAQLQPGQKHLKRVIAEMGGKNAVIVDESADLDQAVAGVVQSAFGYSGQKCSACSRAIVLAPIYDAFLERLVEATRSLNVGNTTDPSVQMGPVIDGTAQGNIRKAIAAGKTEARLVLELPSPDPGYFVGPVIFADVPPTATIAQEEIFGPVLAVIKASNFSEALEIANGTDYALTGGLYSRTPSHIEAARTDFEVGNLYINRGITGAIVSRQPFGGFKLSGVGSKAGGPDYLLQFLEPRTVTENVQRQGFAVIEGAEQ